MYFPEYDLMDATELAERIRSGDISPKDALRAALDRAASRNPQLNAIVTPLTEFAERQVASLPPQGPFAGVPFLIKDLLLSLEGYPTSYSNALLAKIPQPHTSHLAKRYMDAGLLIFGKTNTPEFGIMGTTEPKLHGPTHNPWDLTRSPGGSSGGSGAAVAARICPMAHGGDGGGSIRIPAAACGLFGLKPSRGRVSQAPICGEAWGGFVQEHVLTRSVRDSAAMLDLSCGYVPGDPYSSLDSGASFLSQLGAAPRPLRIAFCRTPIYGESHDAATLEGLDIALKHLEALGHHVEEAAPTFSKEAMVRAYVLTIAANVAADIANAAQAAGVSPRARDFEAETWMLGQIGRSTPASDLIRAQQDMHQMMRTMAAFHQSYDLFVTPTLGRLPVKLGELAPSASERASLALLRAIPAKFLLDTAVQQMAGDAFSATPNTSLFNQTGQPAMSVPMHWTSDGLPVGIQFVAPYGSEALLFRLAAQIEAAYPWADKLPAMVDKDEVGEVVNPPVSA